MYWEIEVSSGYTMNHYGDVRFEGGAVLILDGVGGVKDALAPGSWVRARRVDSR